LIIVKILLILLFWCNVCYGINVPFYYFNGDGCSKLVILDANGEAVLDQNGLNVYEPSICTVKYVNDSYLNPIQDARGDLILEPEWSNYRGGVPILDTSGNALLKEDGVIINEP
jgi:hypothetical protein